MKAIILSAGQGRRLMPLTANTPKCCVVLNGKTLLEHQVESLVANGIDQDAIGIVPQEVVAVATALETAKEGDLVVLFADDVRRSWNQVLHFESDSEDTSTAVESKPAHSFVEEDPDAFSLEPGTRLVRDERGVRLARDEEESD